MTASQYELILMQPQHNKTLQEPAPSRKGMGLPAVGKSPHTPPQDELLSDVHLPLRRTYYPLGYAIDIATNDSTVLDAAQRAFGHRTCLRHSGLPAVSIAVQLGGSALVPPDPIRRQYNHLYSFVADGANQALLDFHTGHGCVWVTQAVARDQLYFCCHFLEKVVYLLLGASVVTDIHAACVGKSGKGILLCGDSGAGKSSLAYACARDGWTYTSDDTCYLINNSAFPRVIGHSHRARFRPTACDLFPELRAFPLSPRLDGKPSIEVLSAKLPISQSSFETNVHAVIFLHRSPVSFAQLTRCPPGTANRRLAANLFSAGQIRTKHTANLEKLAEVPTFELHYNCLDDAIRALDELVRSDQFDRGN